MKSFGSILLQTLIVVLVSSCAEPVVLSAAPSGIATGEDQTLRPAPNAFTRCAPGELLVKWKEGPDSPAATLGNAQIGSTVQRNFNEIGWQQVKLPGGLSLQEGIARYRALGSVSAVEPNYAVAPILPPRRDATDPPPGVGNTARRSRKSEIRVPESETENSSQAANDLDHSSTGLPPSVEDEAPDSTDQLPTPHSALRTEQSAAAAPTLIIPNDPKFSAQWDLKKIGMTNAWAITTGSSNVVVAILDTGVDYNHEDLAANMWRNPGETGLDANGHDKSTNGIDDDGDGYVDDVYGIDAVDHDSDPMDLGFTRQDLPQLRYHGTMCAGVIGAVGNNGKGVTGINWSVQIMALRVAGVDQSIGPVDAFGSVVGDVLEAFNYLIQQRRRGVNIRVTSNSYDGYYSQVSTLALRDAINIAGTEGILTVCSAGNDGNSTDSFSKVPAAFDSPYVISVAASDFNDGMPSYSNFGRSTVDLAAPSEGGVGITTTSRGSKYVNDFGGTSAACPHVAGAAALLWSVKPDATPLEIKRALMQSVDQKPAFRGRVVSNGRLNVASALQVITNASLPPVILGAFPASSRVRQDAMIEVWFSAPMDRASVETALQITPTVSGTAEWSDGDRILRLRPSVPLARTNYTARILGTAHDLAGQTLDGDFNRTSGGSPADDYVWGFRFAPQNDDFADALTLTGTSGSLKGNTADASFEPDEPLDNGYPFYPLSLWYRWVPDRDGWVTFDTSTPGGLDTIVAAYTGSMLASLVQVAFNDNFGATRGGRISFPVIAGTNYSITVAGHVAIGTGSVSDGIGAFTLAWYPTPLPSFTDAQFSPAQGSAGATVTLTGTNFMGATSVSFNGASATFTNALKNFLDLKITAIVPPDATSGPITIVTPHGSITSTNFFDVLPPPLTARLTGGNELEIAWPATGSAFVLEVSADLSAGSWLPVAQSPVVGNGQSSLKLAPGSRNWFYRLRRN